MKLHTALHYENLAFTVKSYSYALYNLLNNHAKEDRKQAEMIYQDTINSKEHEGVKAFDNVLLPLIYIDESKDDIEAIAVDILEAFIWIEKQVYQQFIAHESFGYADISKFRIAVLEEALNCIEKKQFLAHTITNNGGSVQRAVQFTLKMKHILVFQKSVIFVDRYRVHL